MKKELSENEIKMLMDGVEKNRAMVLPLIKMSTQINGKTNVEMKIVLCLILTKIL